MWERKESSGLFLPPSTGALTTCKTLFNLIPSTNVGNHRSPSNEGEKENIPLVSNVSVLVTKINKGKSGKDFM